MKSGFIKTFSAIVLGAGLLASCMGENYTRVTLTMTPDRAFAVMRDSVICDTLSKDTLYNHRLFLSTTELDSAGFLASIGSMASISVVSKSRDTLECGTYTPHDTEEYKPFTWVRLYYLGNRLYGSFWEDWHAYEPTLFGLYDGTLTISKSRTEGLRVVVSMSCGDYFFNASYDGKVVLMDSLKVAAPVGEQETVDGTEGEN